ncbi:TonB-dependent receptor [Bacteroides sp. 51]|uniref:SusC/RagA family TonB-linked outer membrane protein n=1 Tax=Bacteroides sp. 51 TaxID=2302938 RepID=UPI0013D5C0E4|nr:TonB-dependent receptor [Bacteroides sp. 51]
MKNNKHAGNCASIFRQMLLAIVFFAGATTALAQNRNITGTVVDPRGESIIGASVLEKGTSNGTITDIDGNFSLSVTSNTILQISYIGYVSQEIKAETGKTMRIVLSEDTQTLDEVVVVGFGTQKKVNLTGSVGLADAKDLESRPVTSATQALQGIVPGLQITTNTGEMDKDMKINIRGTGTIGEGSSGSPLILIDGMEGDLNSVNPQDIENISVLKDAAASSIYGSRAPFGVILVTTKSGKAGKISVNYNNSFRFSKPINLPESMDSYTFANYFNAAHFNNGSNQFFSDQVMQNMLDYQAGILTTNLPASSNGQWGKPQYDPYTNAYANTDWYREIYKSEVFSQEHNMSVTGGSEKVNYYASFNYLEQGGLLRHADDGLDRYNLTGKMNATITDWLKFNYNIRFTRSKNYRPTYFGDSFYDNFGRSTWPNLPVKDPNGYYYGNGNDGGNPAMAMALGGKRSSVTDRHYYQGALILEPIKNWVTHVELNYSIMNYDLKETSLPRYDHNVEGNLIDTQKNSYLYQEQKKENYMNLNIYSEYNHSFLDAHNVKVMAGFQSEEMKQDVSSVQRYGVMIEGMPYFDLTTGTNGKGSAMATTVKGNGSEWATAGFFGRLNYDYQGRYLAEVNYRYDGTSRFRRGSRWETSPSFSAGWNISNESFWEPLSGVANLLKLRFSYGQLGNQNTSGWYPTYRIMDLKPSTGTWLNNGAKPDVSSVGELISTALTWETVRTWDVGVDFGLFSNRLTGSFDYYVRYTDNMVGPALELPKTLGTDVPKTNNCDLKTQGWELSVNWRDRLKNGLGYSVGVSLSDAVTYIESYPGNSTNSIDSYMAGRKMGEIWGLETVGIAKTDAEMQAHLDKVGGQAAFGNKWAAGDIMYADLDGKPGITEGARTLDDHGDLKVIGNSTPRYFFGIDLSADWKGFDMRCFFQGVMKRDYFQNTGHFWGIYSGVWRSRGFKVHEDYFRAEPIGLPGHEIPANMDAYYPRPIVDNGTSMNHRTQTRYLLDASYIRLKNFQIGYTLPGTWMQKIGLTKCRVFLSGENLWTGTNLTKLFDPETINGGSNNKNNSQTYMSGNAYPLSKTWSFGLSVTL